MGINIFRLQQNEPVLKMAANRRHANGDLIGPTLPDGSFYSNTSTSNKESFSWNNLVSTLGSSISSIFNGLSGMKNAEAAANYNQYQQKKSNSLLWIGIAVVAVIVIAIILVSRKK